MWEDKPHETARYTARGTLHKRTPRVYLPPPQGENESHSKDNSLAEGVNSLNFALASSLTLPIPQLFNILAVNRLFKIICRPILFQSDFSHLKRR